MGPNGFYSTNKLGAFGADLGAVACFFHPLWARISPNLPPSAQGWLLNEAGRYLRALGRLTEAREPMRAGLDRAVAQQDWENAAIAVGNLIELELTLGEVEAAVRDSESAIVYADRSGDAFGRGIGRAGLAEAVHQAGRRAEAGRLFAEAEAARAEQLPEYPLLYSLAGLPLLRLATCRRRARVLTDSAGRSHGAAVTRTAGIMPSCFEAVGANPGLDECAGSAAPHHRPRSPHPRARRALCGNP
jgi:tetratricopeptide (TPR) repeat protein